MEKRAIKSKRRKYEKGLKDSTPFLLTCQSLQPGKAFIVSLLPLSVKCRFDDLPERFQCWVKMVKSWIGSIFPSAYLDFSHLKGKRELKK